MPSKGQRQELLADMTSLSEDLCLQSSMAAGSFTLSLLSVLLTTQYLLQFPETLFSVPQHPTQPGKAELSFSHHFHDV